MSALIRYAVLHVCFTNQVVFNSAVAFLPFVSVHTLTQNKPDEFPAVCQLSTVCVSEKHVYYLQRGQRVPSLLSLLSRQVALSHPRHLLVPADKGPRVSLMIRTHNGTKFLVRLRETPLPYLLAIESRRPR